VEADPGVDKKLIRGFEKGAKSLTIGDDPRNLNKAYKDLGDSQISVTVHLDKIIDPG
jgi:hypothetical protein